MNPLLNSRLLSALLIMAAVAPLFLLDAVVVIKPVGGC